MKKIILLLGCLLIAGCESISAGDPYRISSSNVLSVQQLLSENQKIQDVNVGFRAGYQPDLTCRLIGVPDFGRGKDVLAYIEDAFVDELLSAGRADGQSSTVITLTVNELSFSSVSPAYWQASVLVDSSTSSKSFEVNVKQPFSTSWSALFACQNLTFAFAPFVSDIISSIVRNSQFPSMVRKSAPFEE